MSNALQMASSRREWKKTVPQKEVTLKHTSQKCKLDLVVHVIMAKASDVDPVSIWVSLENSLISSGKMTDDDDDKRGYFQDRVIVDMWLEDKHGKKLTSFRRVSDGPSTVNGSSSTSSSVSFSFSSSLSASVGFFGGTPTGNVGGGINVGVSESHSFSKSLSDFRAINNSDQYRTSHTYKMSASSGGAYNKAVDLVPKGDSIGFFDAFKGIKLYSPPDLAVANLPLISQAVWQANDNKDHHEDVVVKVQVKQRVVLVDGRNDFVSVHSHSGGWELAYGHTETLKLSELIAPPQPAPIKL